MTLPDAPLRIPDEMDECGRVRWLEYLSEKGAADPRVAAFARRAISVAAPWGDEVSRAAALLAAVQALPYVPEPEGIELFQPAGYTLSRGGDCDDLAVLFAAAARASGLRAQAVWVTQHGRPINHVTAIVFLRGAWQWAEPSIRGAELGESPWSPRLAVLAARAGVA